jgi:hypothetical protein
MLERLSDETLGEDDDGGRESIEKYMKDLGQMMDGMLDLNRRGQLPDRERAICMKLLLRITLKEDTFDESERFQAQEWLAVVEGSRRRNRIEVIPKDKIILNKGKSKPKQMLKEDISDDDNGGEEEIITDDENGGGKGKLRLTGSGKKKPEKGIKNKDDKETISNGKKKIQKRPVSNGNNYDKDGDDENDDNKSSKRRKVSFTPIQNEDDEGDSKPIKSRKPIASKSEV